MKDSYLTPVVRQQSWLFQIAPSPHCVQGDTLRQFLAYSRAPVIRSFPRQVARKVTDNFGIPVGYKYKHPAAVSSIQYKPSSIRVPLEVIVAVKWIQTHMLFLE